MAITHPDHLVDGLHRRVPNTYMRNYRHIYGSLVKIFEGLRSGRLVMILTTFREFLDCQRIPRAIIRIVAGARDSNLDTFKICILW